LFLIPNNNFKDKKMKKIILMLVMLYSSAQAQNMKNMTNDHTEKITLGGGCYWCIEAVFQMLNGVVKVESGFSGGK
jgi:peptide-methionine (S)-S-oxide reductase